MAMQKGDLVLITGISGYLATWVAKFLLEEGFRVRGTVRSTKNAQQQEKLQQILPGAEYVEADLRSEEGWDEAVKDVNGSSILQALKLLLLRKTELEGLSLEQNS